MSGRHPGAWPEAELISLRVFLRLLSHGLVQSRGEDGRPSNEASLLSEPGRLCAPWGDSHRSEVRVSPAEQQPSALGQLGATRPSAGKPCVLCLPEGRGGDLCILSSR